MELNTLYKNISTKRSIYMQKHNLKFNKEVVPAFNYNDLTHSHFNSDNWEDPIVHALIEQLTDLFKNTSEITTTLHKKQNNQISEINIINLSENQNTAIILDITWDITKKDDYSLFLISGTKEHIKTFNEFQSYDGLSGSKFEKIYNLLN